MTIEETKKQIRVIFEHYLEAIDCVPDEVETIHDEEFDEDFEIIPEDKIGDLIVNCAGDCLNLLGPITDVEEGEWEEFPDEECCCGHHHGHHHPPFEPQPDMTDAYIEAYIDGVRATLNGFLKLDQDDYSYNEEEQFPEEECCCGHHHHQHDEHCHCHDDEDCCCE